PFPPDELFGWLPWRREIIEGLLGADVVGFQTHPDAQDFSRAARQFTPAEGTDTQLGYKGRTIRVGSLPISIAFQAYDNLAADPRVVRHSMDIRRRIGGDRKILLSIDRLDYTKGIDTRMIAFEELLRRTRTHVNNCLLVQVAVPSRESVAEYKEVRSLI